MLQYTSTITFIPGRTTVIQSVSRNVIHDGFRYCLTKKPDERALINAAEKSWPTTTKRGCFFHHKQALWRKLQQHDLVPEYNVENSAVRKSFQMIGAITFVDLGDVLLKPTLPSEMEAFAEYYERTWVGTDTTSPLFSP